MALEKVVVLNALEINVQNPSIDVVKRISFMEDGVEISRKHEDVHYDSFNEVHLIDSESAFVIEAWNHVSSSWVETSGSIS